MYLWDNIEVCGVIESGVGPVGETKQRVQQIKLGFPVDLIRSKGKLSRELFLCNPGKKDQISVH